MKILATILFCTLLISCASTSENVTNNAEFENMFEDAEEAIDKAASVGGEWRDSRLILNQSREAAQKGEMEKAMMLIKQAKEQGEMGYKQAIEQQKTAAPWLF